MKAQLVKRDDRWDLYNEDGHKIASTLDGATNKLSLKNCQAIERGYDLDELAELKFTDTDGDVSYDKGLIIGFKEGFQKALELMGDKKFSEEDVRKAIEIARNGSMQEQHNGYGRPTELRFVLDNISSDEIIQSLKQTEWDVTFDPDEKDANGRLILKRK